MIASESPFQIPPPSPLALLSLMVLPSIVIWPMVENTPPPIPLFGKVEVAKIPKRLPLMELPPRTSIGPPKTLAMPAPISTFPAGWKRGDRRVDRVEPLAARDDKELERLLELGVRPASGDERVRDRLIRKEQAEPGCRLGVLGICGEVVVDLAVVDDVDAVVFVDQLTIPPPTPPLMLPSTWLPCTMTGPPKLAAIPPPGPLLELPSTWLPSVTVAPPSRSTIPHCTCRSSCCCSRGCRQ